jgi:TrpR family transcriptional regulator, trp operon repressor
MNEKKLEESWRKLLKLIKKTPYLEEFMNILLTKEEINMLPQRFLIIEALIKNQETQREISKNLKVSIAKITRGSNALKGIDIRLKKFLQNEFTRGQ